MLHRQAFQNGHQEHMTPVDSRHKAQHQQPLTSSSAHTQQLPLRMAHFPHAHPPAGLPPGFIALGWVAAPGGAMGLSRVPTSQLPRRQLQSQASQTQTGASLATLLTSQTLPVGLAGRIVAPPAVAMKVPVSTKTASSNSK